VSRKRERDEKVEFLSPPKVFQGEVPQEVAGKSCIVVSGDRTLRSQLKSFLEANPRLGLKSRNEFPDNIANEAGRFIYVEGERAAPRKTQTAVANSILTWTSTELIDFMDECVESESPFEEVEAKPVAIPSNNEVNAKKKKTVTKMSQQKTLFSSWNLTPATKEQEKEQMEQNE
jgi:hypothetical protein